MVDWMAYAQSLEAEAEEIARRIKPYEEGRTQIGRRAGGQWIDMSKEWVAQDRRTIATLKRLAEEARQQASHPK